jgi:POT family proton-dependent oligopeptide transporter
LILTAFSFIIIYFLQVHIDQGGKPSVGWQILAYIILTAAEILVSLTGLEYAYTQAPASMKSTVMSFWLLAVSAGNFFVTMINSNISEKGFFSKLEGADYYLFFIGVITFFIVLFILVSGKLKERKADD